MDRTYRDLPEPRSTSVVIKKLNARNAHLGRASNVNTADTSSIFLPYDILLAALNLWVKMEPGPAETILFHGTGELQTVCAIY